MNFYKKLDKLYNKLVETKIIYFLIGFSILFSYYLLYIFRSLDNTVLMSWKVVFTYVDITIYELLFILSIVIFISFIISRINIFNKCDEEKYHILFLFFSGIIIGSRFWNIPEINPDAARYFTAAKYLELNGIWRYFGDWGHGLQTILDFPTIPFLYGIVFRYFGEYRIYIQIFNTILFSLTAVLTYKISKKLWNEEVGLYAGLLLMSFPFLLSQVPLMLIEIPYMFLTIFSAFLFFKIFDNMYYSIPASIVIFLAVYSKMSSIFILLPIVFILIVNHKSVIANKQRWIFTIIFSSALVISFFIWKMDVMYHLKQLLLNALNINQFYESPLNYLFQVGPLVILLSLSSIILSLRKKDLNCIIPIAWIAIPFLFLNDLRIRHMIPVFPFIAIMASMSLSSIKNKNIKRFFILSLALTSIAFTVFAYIPFEENFTDRNIKEAAEFTNSLNISAIEVFLDFSEKHPYNPDPMVSQFDIYSHKKIIYSEENKFYPVADYSNQWTALYRIPLFFYVNTSSSLSKNDRIIVIISDKEQSNSTLYNLIKDHILAKKFESKTFSIFNPSSVQIYLPRNNSQ